MKKKIFPKIIYYLFTFSIGLILAFTLPMVMAMLEVPKETQRSLLEGEYYKAMELVGGFFNKEHAFQQDFEEGGGIVLFEAATLVYNTKEEGDKTKDETQLHKSYAGFVYGIKDTFPANGTGENKTVLTVTDALGETHDIALLDKDSDGDKINDSVGTLAPYGFIYLDLDINSVKSISKLTFKDKNGNVFKNIDVAAELGRTLDYSETFFADVNEFITCYNVAYGKDTAITEDEGKELQRLGSEFKAKSENYLESSAGDTKSIGDKKSVAIIVSYFVFIYIVADFLVGRHYIIRFFKWLIGKIRKNKPVEEKKEVFGHDYYSQVTVSLDVGDLEDFSESVQVRYSNVDREVTFLLLKDENYTSTQRVKAGTYLNPWIDLNRDYAPVDLPDNLVVEGYRKEVKIKIIKRKEESV